MTDKRVKILNYDIDLLSFNEAIDFALDKMQRHEFLHVVTLNPEIITLADNNTELAEIINKSELVLPESSGIKLALKLKGINQEQIPGIDFAKELIKQCAQFGYDIALIGAKEHVIVKAAIELKQEFPDVNIVYSHNGYYDNDDEIISKVVLSKPRLVLCALGAPKQEIFINKCSKQHNNAVYIGVGGSFDVWAKEVERAPKLFQKLGLEWLYRTIKQPSRLKRIYKTLPMFLFRAIIDSMRK